MIWSQRGADAPSSTSMWSNQAFLFYPFNGLLLGAVCIKHIHLSLSLHVVERNQKAVGVKCFWILSPFHSVRSLA